MTSGSDHELSYLPVVLDAAGVVESLRPPRVLVVGPRIPDGVEVAPDVKLLDESGVALPAGVYTFEEDDGHSVMVVTEGALPGMPEHADWSAPDDHALIRSYGWFGAWWDQAAAVPTPAFAVNAPVLVLPDRQEGHVRRRDYDHGEWFYDVRLDGGTKQFRERTLAAPEIDDDPFQWIARPADPARRLAATITRAKLSEDLTDTVYSFRASRTIFRPYQFRPILRLLASGSMRLLVADEVGLGKTIEAGLVWTELDARRQADRVLIVCPSMLVGKWRGEMEQRFGYDLVELDGPALDDMLDKFEDDRFPRRFHGVVSVERLRVWGGLERLAQLSPQFDLIVVDEAHIFRNSGTRSHALGALLSDWADAFVFLSATPLNLGNDDLFNLLELLAPGEFDDRIVLEQRLMPNAVLNRVSASLIDRTISSATRLAWLGDLDQLVFGRTVTSRPEYAELVELLRRDELGPGDIALGRRLVSTLHALSAVVTRTRKVEIQDHKAVREVVPIDVEWTEEEADLYRQIDAWQQARARRLGLPVGFATQMPLRLASTCLPAARDRILGRAGQAVVLADLADEEELDLDGGGLDEAERRMLEDPDVPSSEVVAAAKRLGDVDTKFDRFVETLRPIVEDGRQVLLFSFSRPTLAYLYERLSPTMRVAVMHGGIHKDERPELIARFRRGEFDVLLASRVASEGLDFEFCSAVVNYDLPWNPMEVEQRIGRIDRFGQTEDKVLILNFHTPGTIETDIVDRVHTRIGVFTDSIGELEPILRRSVGELRKTMFDFRLTPEQRDRRLDEMMAAIEEQRHALAEVENASAFLASADQAEIDGLERDLVSSGRYVGQPELVLLLEEWVARAGGARCQVSDDGKWLHIRGSAALDADLRTVQTLGERSAAEIDQLSKALRDEVDVHLCLDQEHAREVGATLLSANHPFVRAALASSGSGAARYASLRLESPDLEPGRYVVTISLVKWSGVRPSAELWTSAIALDGGAEGDDVGRATLAALAEARWGEGPIVSAPIERALQSATSDIRRRLLAEEARRIQENESLLELRRISLRETFQRKEGVIRRRIASARAGGSTVAVRLGESQLAAQSRMLADAEAQLENAGRGSMDLEHLAVCHVEVTA
jgi:superfamily II DNA or RNA helicase